MPSLLLLLLLVGGGCARNGDQDNQVDVDRLRDQLRSLPYVNYAKLPSDGESGVVTIDKELSYPGYNLYVVRSLCLAELLDHEGNPVQSWHADDFRIWQDFELLPDGTFLVLGQKKVAGDGNLTNPFGNRALLRFSWQGKKLEEISIPAHHEIHFSAGKPLLTLLFKMRLIEEQHPIIPVLDNRVATLSAHGEVLADISLYDLLNTTPGFKLQKVKATETPSIKCIDLFHTNTVEWLTGKVDSPLCSADNILVTMRHQDTLAIVDWKTRKVIWTWGQGELSGPHDATMLDNGNILVFDNGLGRGWSRVIEIDPLDRKIVWEYRAPDPKTFYTATRGTNQRLPNGNTLITESNEGRVFEVLPSGSIVWAFNTPHKDEKGRRANIIRMKRYPPEFIQAIRDTVGGDG